MLTLKVAVVGNTEAGKSALLQRYVDGTFTSVYKATTSSEYKVKPMQPVPPPPAKATTLLKILLWDTAGSDKLQAVERCKGAMAAIVVHRRHCTAPASGPSTPPPPHRYITSDAS